ncbi:MAG: hypothetical protein H7X92_10485 [Chitinophagales bacterium]|nr:hypothetical protein [Hyphomicrobiales bacterium]
MILYLMLVALGFFLACFLFVLIAPSFWSRAVRLTRRRMESTMPLTISEIEAEKDQLRASFAVKIRRLEAALGKAKAKSSQQLVDISLMQMGATTLKDEIAALERNLDERRNAAAVFEMTIKKRFPELENALAASQSSLAQRAYEVGDLTNKIRRREEALALAQRSAGLQQAEIARLREAMEKSGGERSTRFKKRPSQWSLDEYRSEYDRLNVELSKLREQLSGAYDREAHQITYLKAELQQLAEQIIAASPAEPRVQSRAIPVGEIDAPAAKNAEITPPRAQVRRPIVERSLARPQPWLKNPERREAMTDNLEVKAETESWLGRDRLQDVRVDDFENKSLQEVLEAALPMSGEAVIVREERPSEPLQKMPSSLIAPILTLEKLTTGEMGVTSTPPNVDAASNQQAAILDDANVDNEASVFQSADGEAKSRLASEDDKPVSSETLAAEDLDNAAPTESTFVSPVTDTSVGANDMAKETNVIKHAFAEGANVASEASAGTDAAGLPAASETVVLKEEKRAADLQGGKKNSTEDRDPASAKRTLLERLRGVDERVG